MAPVSAGGVYTLPWFPHQDNKEEGEKRWILIVESFVRSVSIVPLTTKLHQEKNYKKCIKVLARSPEGKRMGIPADSLIICDREVEYDISGIKGLTRKGECSDNLLDEIFELLNSK